MHVSVDCISCLSKDIISASSISLYVYMREREREKNKSAVRKQCLLNNPANSADARSVYRYSTICLALILPERIQHHLFHSWSNYGISSHVAQFLASLSTSTLHFLFPYFFFFSLISYSFVLLERHKGGSIAVLIMYALLVVQYN